ncbi:MAG: hypothetical protein AB7O37_16840 [Vicinamibacteria bacterium]
MSHHPFDTRSSLRALTGLDFGLRVRVEVVSPQRRMFGGAENASVQGLVSELAEMVSGLRVYSYALRGQLEQVTYALQANVECGSWRYARRAALDLAGLLQEAKRRRLANADRCSRGAECAARVADLCVREVR